MSLSRSLIEPGEVISTSSDVLLAPYSPFTSPFFCGVAGNDDTINSPTRLKRKGRPVKRMTDHNAEFNIAGTTGDSVSHSQEFQKRVCTFNPYSNFPGNQQLGLKDPSKKNQEVTGYMPENMWEFRSLVDRAMESQPGPSNSSNTDKSYSYRFFEEYAKHYATYLENKKTHVSSSNQVYRCEYACCNKKFKSPEDLHVHVQSHLTVLKPHECHKCGKSYNHPDTLDRHMRTHERREIYPCDKCQMQFTDVNRLIRHKKEHSRRKTFTCEHCGKILSKAITLLMHQRIHSGEKPFSCEYCGKKFSYYNNLLVHTRTHSGEKPYGCVECGKKFTQGSTLTIHMRTHSGEKPYACDQCDKAFTCGNSLNIHKRSHSGEKPYRCLECGKAYSQASSLATHRKSHIK